MARNRRFTVGLSGARPRRWKSEFLSIKFSFLKSLILQEKNLTMIITLTPDECKTSVAFGKEIVEKKAQSKRDFGSNRMRGVDDNTVDIVEGKLAEVGFAKFYHEKTGNSVELDFKIYLDQLTIDYGNDLDKIFVGTAPHLVKCKIDIKATRAFSKWLLVESHKFWADAYVLCKINVPTDSEENIEKFLEFINTNGVTVDVAGFAYHFDLIDNNSKEPFIAFNQNERMFRPERLNDIQDWTPSGIKKYISEHPADFESMGPQLKAPKNFGMPIIKLRQSTVEWNKLFLWINNSLS